MMLAAGESEFGRVGWIAATVLAFIVWWPLGLASLAFVAIRKLMGFGPRDAGRWYAAPGFSAPGFSAPGAGRAGPWRSSGCGWGRHAAPQSGNAAFDDYRAETLRRLEDEQREFVEYLERLRRARDKAEFDQFMADRRRSPMPQSDTPEAA